MNCKGLIGAIIIGAIIIGISLIIGFFKLSSTLEIINFT